MEIRIGKEVFKTKKELLARIKGMLHAATLGVELDPPEHVFLLELVKRHPEGERKIGPGVKAFRVTTSEYGNRCFEVIRVDGTETDFSYLKCVTEPSELGDFRKALRRAVERQIWEAKEKVFLWDEEIECPVSGERMTREQAVVEYVGEDFESILMEFMEVEGLEKHDLPLGPWIEGKREIADPNLEDRWKAFHESRAKFRVLSLGEQKRQKKKESVS